MARILWRASARDDLRQILTFIARENPAASRRLRTVIERAVLSAALHPKLFRHSDRVPGLREIVAHPNYIVLYRAADGGIEVVSVVHSRREFPPQP
ncbi:type II toxin-antitoxin system RelE/ParE family toxin [Amphibiibacter pelophylacis]|uniref:Type II toxin-antitoxin system RelE/ParE family toxin n=1 Tax=Amphibiibacter pelophylacis TaxID=1799477 RepID=A0ACC6NY63_9BURK